LIGTHLTKDEAAKLAISGDSLLCRARQIQWALTKRRAVDQINCSIGVKSAAGDDDGIKKTNCGFRCLGYFDEDLNAPASYPLYGLPTGRKTSEAGASALIKGCHDKEISTVDVSEGFSENALNARAINK
jgi:hypothetical protein